MPHTRTDRRSRASRAIDAITQGLGHQLSVGAAICVVVLWLVGGLFFGYSNTYQLVINTGTTIITFVMVFAIQHTTNRETRAMNLKLDELIHATGGKPEFIGAEDESERKLKEQQMQERQHRRASPNGSSKETSTATKTAGRSPSR